MTSDVALPRNIFFRPFCGITFLFYAQRGEKNLIIISANVCFFAAGCRKPFQCYLGAFKSKQAKREERLQSRRNLSRTRHGPTEKFTVKIPTIRKFSRPLFYNNIFYGKVFRRQLEVRCCCWCRRALLQRPLKFSWRFRVLRIKLKILDSVFILS